jgi:hypothetical protein
MRSALSKAGMTSSVNGTAPGSATNYATLAINNDKTKAEADETNGLGADLA